MAQSSEQSTIKSSEVVAVVADPAPSIDTKEQYKDEDLTTPISPTARHRWYQYFSETDTPAERRLILKIDGLIIIFLWLAFWAKILDGASTTNAYITGMKTDLRLYGNELNYLNASFQQVPLLLLHAISDVRRVGYLVFQIPLTLLVTRLPVNYLLPAADLLWGIFTLVQYKVSNVQQLYVLRFFGGALSGFFLPAAQWYLGCWYKKSELNRRGALFFVAAQVGGMCSGYVARAAHANLNGIFGIAGWRWLYIIGFGATVPIALIGFIFLPGIPTKSNSWFLSEKELLLAQERMTSENRQPPKAFNREIVTEVLRGWHLWVLVGLAFLILQADGIVRNAGFPLWLISTGHSIEYTTTIATVAPAVTIVSSIICGIIADAYDAKVFLITVLALLNLFAAAILSVWDVPDGLKYFAFFVSGTIDSVLPLLYAWANEICAANSEERAIVISSMNMIGNIFGAFLPLLIWKTVDAPRYLVGYSFTVALNLSILVVAFVLRSFWNREQTRAALVAI